MAPHWPCHPFTMTSSRRRGTSWSQVPAITSSRTRPWRRPLTMASVLRREAITPSAQRASKLRSSTTQSPRTLSRSRHSIASEASKERCSMIVNQRRSLQQVTTTSSRRLSRTRTVSTWVSSCRTWRHCKCQAVVPTTQARPSPKKPVQTTRWAQNWRSTWPSPHSLFPVQAPTITTRRCSRPKRLNSASGLARGQTSRAPRSCRHQGLETTSFLARLVTFRISWCLVARQKSMFENLRSK